MPKNKLSSPTQSFTVLEVPKEYVHLFEKLLLDETSASKKVQTRTDIFLKLVYEAAVNHNRKLGNIETMEQAKGRTDKQLARYRKFDAS